MELEFENRIKKKANFDSVNEALAKKVDVSFLDTLIDRINKIEELATASSL